MTLPSRIAPVAELQYATGMKKSQSPDGSSATHPVTVRRHRVKRKHLPLTPPNTPFAANLTRSDVDKIRQMALHCYPRSDGSESTATSQISCPDSTDGRQFDSVISSSLQLTPSSSRLSVVSEDVDKQRWLQDVPSVIEVTETNASETTFRNECLEHLHQSSETVLLQSTEREGADKCLFEDDIESKQGIEDANIKKTCESIISVTSEECRRQQVNATFSEPSQQELMATPTEKLQQVAMTSSEPSQQVTKTSSEPPQEVAMTSSEPSQEVAMTSSEPSQEVAMTSSEPSQEVAMTSNEPSQEFAMTSSEPPQEVTMTSTDHTTENTALASGVTTDKRKPGASDNISETTPQDKARHIAAIPEFHPVRKATPLEPQLSDVTACFAQVDPASEAECETDAMSVDSREGYLANDMRGVTNEAFIQGNSLGSMQGWSSEFENGVTTETGLGLSDGRHLETERVKARQSQNTGTE